MPGSGRLLGPVARCRAGGQSRSCPTSHGPGQSGAGRAASGHRRQAPRGAAIAYRGRGPVRAGLGQRALQRSGAGRLPARYVDDRDQRQYDRHSHHFEYADQFHYNGDHRNLDWHGDFDERRKLDHLWRHNFDHRRHYNRVDGGTTSSTTTPNGPVQGEGLLRLALQSPGTTWGPGAPSSTVVDATLTDVTAHHVVGAQQFVLFWGSSPFVYAGFAGPVRMSDRYSVTISVEPPARRGGLSQPAPGTSPRVVLRASALEVVSPANPQYLAYAYAPVMYGRSTSALHDTPLVTYADVTQTSNGAHLVSYVIVWSHEDAGTGFLPFLEWGTWGRMTDIENAISLTVAPDGSVSGTRYLWGGEPRTGFPDSQSALRELDTTFAGTWWGHHPVLRDATGNNDFSDHGTTRFRFQLGPVAAPATGQARDAVMDANPFTYQVMAKEVARWYADISTNPGSPDPGQAEQYAIVDLGTSGRGVSSVAVDVQLSGYPQWFRSDLGWGYPLIKTGHARTVVKLPLNWASERVTGVQVVVEPPSAAPTVTVHWLHIERFTGSSVQQVPVPVAVVRPETLNVTPVALPLG